MQTHRETILRYRILRHCELPEAHKAEYRKMGIEPDGIWDIIWSFSTEEAAMQCLEECRQDAAFFETYEFRDNGTETVIERPISI